MTDLLLAQIVGKVGNHDLVLGGDTVLRRTTLARLARGLWLGGLGFLLAILSFGGRQRFVRSVGERLDLTWNIGRAVSSDFTLLALLLSATATTSLATSTATTTATAATTSIGALALRNALAVGLGLFRLAGQLNEDSTIEDGLLVELVDSTLGLSWSGDVNKGVSDWASRARVGRNRG